MSVAIRIAPLLAAVATTAVAMRPAQASQGVAFTHVTVIDGDSPTPRVDETVVVQANRIVAAGPSASVAIPAGTRVIDGRGKYLVPGFWDMHVHTVVPGGREVLGLYVANGVTGVRDMAGEWPTLRAWRHAIARGELVGPRLLVSGPYLEGGDIPIPHLLARTPDEARTAVDSLARLGVDFVKVHGQLTPPTYFAIARAVRERGLTFGGHIPRGVSAAEASDSGQKSLEHLLAIPTPCTPADSIALQPRFPMQAFLARCSSVDLTSLFARFVRNGTWIVPTFVAQYEIAVLPVRTLPGDSLARYLPDTLRQYVASIFEIPKDVPAGADSVGLALFAKRLALVGAMHRASVRILPGTDAPLRNSPPGFGLHEELVALVRAGMTPFEALRAATLEPARFFGMTDSLGTVAVGKLADLVLLDGNPLEDIRHTRRVAAVVANGRLFDAEARRSLLRSSGRAAPPDPRN